MKSFIAFDWDASQLRVVRAELRDRRVQLIGAFVVPFDEAVDAGNPEQVGAVLRQQLDAQDWHERQAVGLVRRHDAVLHWISIPAASPDEVAQMIHFQAASELALADDDSTYDYLLEGRSDAGALRALIAVTPARCIEAVTNVARAAGLDLQAVAMDTLARLAAFHEWASQRQVSGNGDVEILVSADQRFIATVATSTGEFLADQLVPLSGDSPDPIAVARVAVQRTIGTLHSQNRFATVSGVTVCDPADAAWVAKLQQALEEEVRAFDPFAEAGLQVEASCVNMVALAGAVVEQTLDRNRRIDFLHPRRPTGPSPLRKYRWPIAATAAVVTFAALGLYAAGHLRRLDAELEHWRSEERTASAELRELRPVAQQRDVLANWLEDRHDWLQLYDDVLRILPQAGELYLTQVSFSDARAGQGTIRLEGYAASEAALSAAAIKLAADGRYRVRTGGIVPSGRAADYPWRFEAELIVLPSTESAAADDEVAPLSVVLRR